MAELSLMPLTSTTEDYLLAIYGMRAEAESVINARLAERLHVAAPTVSATLDRMIRDGHVWIDGRRQVFLTLGGERVAERLARRHRLIEHWLIRTLGMGWAEVHEEADRLEHSVSEELTERISASLGHPATCPHGLPIPGNYPETDVTQLFSLSQAKRAKRCELCASPSQPRTTRSCCTISRTSNWCPGTSRQSARSRLQAAWSWSWTARRWWWMSASPATCG